MQRLLLVILGCLAMQGNLNAQDAASYTDRGIDWFQKGEYAKAIADYTEAIRLNPNNSLAYNNRGIAWATKGEYDKAIADFSQALAADKPPVGVAFFDKVLGVKSRNASTYYNRGNAWKSKGEYNKAITDYTETIRLDPTMGLAYNAIAWLQATCPDARCRDGKKAVENATKTCQLDGGKWWGYIELLAAAYAESGDFEKAKQWQAKAIELAAKDKLTSEESMKGLRARLELYKQGKPYHEEAKKK
jgi:tetratricopeptide (TPR) repeat protein